MSYEIGGVEYNISVGTGDLITGRREVGRFGDDTEREFGRSERAANSFNGRISKVASGIKSSFTKSAMFIAGVTTALSATVAAIAVLSKNVAEAAKELEILARQAGLNITQFEALAGATSQFGVSGEQIADISKDITDKVGEFATASTGAFQDFADVVGMSKEEATKFATEIQSLSGRDTLIEMVKRMEEAGASGAQMTFVLESMGNDASRLLPLLKDNATALRQLETRYDKTGTALELTEERMKSLAKVSGEFDALGRAMSSAAAVVVSELAPYFSSWAKGSLELVEELTGAIIKFNNVIKGVETPRTLKELEEDSVNTLTKIQALEDSLKSLSKTNAGDVGGFGVEVPSFFGGGNDTGEELEKKKAELAELKAFYEKTNKELEKIRKEADDKEKTADEVSKAAEQGRLKLQEDAKLKIKQDAALKSLDIIEKSFTNEFESTTQYLANLAMYTDKAMNAQEIAEYERHQTSISMLKAKYEEAKKIAKEGEIDLGSGGTTEAAYKKALEEEIERNRQANAAIFADKEAARNESLEKSKAYFESEKALSEGFNESNKEYRDSIMEQEFLEEDERHQIKMEAMKLRFEEEKLAFIDDAEAKKELRQAYEEAKIAEMEAHSEKVKQIEKDEMEARKAIVLAGYAAIAGAASGFFGTMADIFDSGQEEQSSAYKAMFALQKGFAVAQAGLNFAQAVSSASSAPYPQNIPAVATAITQGTSFVAAVQSATYSGGRRYGGPVDANSMYEVNEAGVPEIVSAGGKDFMTMGSSGGKVTPLDKAGIGGNVTVNNYGNDSVETEKVNGDWFISIAKKEAASAAKGAYNKVAGDFKNNKGRVYDSASQNGNFTGKAGTGR